MLSLAFLCGEVHAQLNLEAKLERMEETVRILERRVASLEEQLRQRGNAAPVAPDKVAWRSLKNGMSERDVEKILGSPSKIEVLGPSATWHYGYPLGGTVRFRNSNAVAWSEP